MRGPPQHGYGSRYIGNYIGIWLSDLDCNDLEIGFYRSQQILNTPERTRD